MVNGINRSQLVNTLFSSVDTKNKGYIEKSDLESVFNSVNSSSSDADSVFPSLDSNKDGKVTKSELGSALDKVASQLNAQFDNMKMSSGMPPPPLRMVKIVDLRRMSYKVRCLVRIVQIVKNQRTFLILYKTLIRQIQIKMARLVRRKQLHILRNQKSRLVAQVMILL